MTVSIGLATRRPGDAAVGAVIARADQALYRAKRTGRNRVVIDDPPSFLPALESYPQPAQAAGQSLVKAGAL
jgi:hypothetical protein